MPRQKKTQERLGFLRTDVDISYFITYVMTLLPGPITYEALLDICLIDEAFGYFEFHSAPHSTGKNCLTHKELKAIPALSLPSRYMDTVHPACLFFQ